MQHTPICDAAFSPATPCAWYRAHLRGELRDRVTDADLREWQSGEQKRKRDAEGDGDVM